MKLKNLLIVFCLLPLLYGCPPPQSLEQSKKQIVKDELILKIQKEIEDLGKTPITEDQAKYQGKLDKDKYIIDQIDAAFKSGTVSATDSTEAAAEGGGKKRKNKTKGNKSPIKKKRRTKRK